MTPTDTPSFPPGFIWGSATSAQQIEGAAAVDGRGPSIWDTFCAQPGRIKDGSNAAIACDHYHRMPDDVALMRGLGLTAYRFSISWSRVQPDGGAGDGAWNEAGFAFYDRLIDELLASGIAPHATLYHWDLPQALHDAFGGWMSRRIVPAFVAYASEVARRFGDRLASISTLNEPWCVATLGYETGQFAPGITSRASAAQVSHHLLLGHGAAIQAMRGITTTSLGIVLNHTPPYAAEPTEADLAAARLNDGLTTRWYMDPVFLGSYPIDVIAHLGADAPQVQPSDMATIRQPLDFLGVNFYTRAFVSTRVPPVPAPGALGFNDMGWEIYPEALTELLLRLTRDYAPPPLLITENGMANADTLGADGHVHDTPRITYLSAHLQAVADAIAQGADVRGYFYWSLLDNFEWDSGYVKRFGLFHTDYATQQRTAKDSACWYSDFIAAQKRRSAQ